MGKLNLTRAVNKVVGSWAKNRSEYQQGMNRVKVARKMSKISRKNAKTGAKINRRAKKLDYKFSHAESIEKNRTIRQGLAQTGATATQALATFGGNPKIGAISQNISGGTTEKEDDDTVIDKTKFTEDGPVNARHFSYSRRRED